MFNAASRRLLQSRAVIGPLFKVSTSSVSVKCGTRAASTLLSSHWKNSSQYQNAALQFSGARYFSVVREPLESLGDSITTAVVLSWSKKPGDAVKEDDVIAVVETDKVTMDIRAKRNGVFGEAFAKEGQEVNVGDDLYTVDTSASASSGSASSKEEKKSSAPSKEEKKSSPAPKEEKKASPAPKEEKKVDGEACDKKAEAIVVSVPIMGESITQGVLAKWFVKEGSSVHADDVVASIETDKVTVEVRSPHTGKICKIFSKEGSEVNVDAQLFTVIPGDASAKKEESGKAAPAEKKSAPAEKESSKESSKESAPASSQKSTASAASSSKSASGGAAKSSSTSAAPSPSTGDRSETRVKMTRMRQRISQRLKESQNTAAMLTTFQEVDMSALIDMRNRHKDEFEKRHGVKLGFMSAFVKASAAALQEIPAVNAVIDDATNEIVFRNYVDVSVAVASPNGLVVPVLRNTEKMTFSGVEKSIAMYGKKAKEGTMALEDMTGGTFTISNGGTFGSLFGTPIINPPQSAILGMHATKMRAVVVNGKVEARPMMYLALTYDHRLIDGREAVTFLKSIQNKIEDPSKLLLEL